MARTRSGFTFTDALVGFGITGFLLFMLGFTVQRVRHELADGAHSSRLEAERDGAAQRFAQPARRAPYQETQREQTQTAPSDSHAGENSVSASAAPSRL